MTSPINVMVVKCPTCKRPVAWLPENTFKPFCCERCRLIDLGEWIMEEKRIPGEAIDLDIDDNEDHFFH
jgi:uncharacterized protein